MIRVYYWVWLPLAKMVYITKYPVDSTAHYNVQMYIFYLSGLLGNEAWWNCHISASREPACSLYQNSDWQLIYPGLESMHEPNLVISLKYRRWVVTQLNSIRNQISYVASNLLYIYIMFRKRSHWCNTRMMVTACFDCSKWIMRTSLYMSPMLLQ